MEPENNQKTQNQQKRRIEQTMQSADWQQIIVATKRKCYLIDEQSTQQCRSSTPPPKLSDWLSKFENMPESTQFDALNAIVPMCKQSQIRYLHTLITPYFQVDFMRCLPKELSLKILGYLAPKDLVLATSVSHVWRHLAEDNVLWAKKCQQYAIKEFFPPNLGQRDNWERFCPGALVPMYDPDWPIPDSLRPPTNQSSSQILLQSPSESPSPSGNSLQIRQQIPSSTVTSSNKLPSFPLPECLERSRFKAIYLRNQRISNNWRHGRRNAKCYLRGHDEHVITCLKLRANRIVTGSDDCTLRVWSVSTGQCTQILSGHTGGVWALQLSSDGQIAISGSTDRTVWNTESGEQIHCLNGHTSTVRCMSLRNKILVTGSRDCTIRMWDIEAGRHIRQFIGHLAAVRCVKFDGETIVSGAYDHKIHVWNGAEGTLSHVLEGHTNRVYSIHFVSDRNLVISGSLDTTIRVWNVKTGECLQTLIGHQSLTSGMKLRDNLLVSANADSTIKVWNILDGTCMHTLAGPNKHASAVTGLRFLENGLVATSGDDGIVKLWDITEGTFVCDLVKLPSSGAGGCVWRMKTTPTLLVCAVGSQNGTEDTKMILMDFDAPYP